MKTASDWQPKYIEDHLDNVGLYFVSNYSELLASMVRVCYKLAQIKFTFKIKVKFRFETD